MESDSDEEEVDLVISNFIPLFECNLSENFDENHLTDHKEIRENSYYCNVSNKIGINNQIDILESRSEHVQHSVNDTRTKVDVDEIRVDIPNSEYIEKPMVNKSSFIDDYAYVSVDKESNRKGYDDARSKPNGRRDLVLEKSDLITLYEYNIPISLEDTNVIKRKHLKVFVKYGGRDNIFIESDNALDLSSINYEFNNCIETQLVNPETQLMNSSALEKGQYIEDDQHNIELQTESYTLVQNRLNKMENNNNNTIVGKDYLNSQYNKKNMLENIPKIHNNESTPWTIQTRTNRKPIDVSKFSDSECEEVLEFEDDDEEWIPNIEGERNKEEYSVLLSDSSSPSSSCFVSPVANETQNKIRNDKRSLVSQSRESSTLSKTERSRQTSRSSSRQNSRSSPRKNSRSSSRTEAVIHYCHHPNCYMYFNRPGRLKIHERTHTGERPFVCSVKDCGSSYIRKEYLQRHMTRSHESKVSTPGKICEKCGKILADVYSLQKHITRCHVRREYACEDCDKVFKKHQHLRTHSYVHTGIQPYECQHPGCDMRFTNPSLVKRHSRIHESGRYECSYETNEIACGEKFDRYHDLRLHLSYNHPKECDVCGKQFKLKRSLRIHRLTHENVREAYFCPVPECDKFYYSNKNLTAHIRMKHEKAYIFECGECKAMLSSKQKLADHMKVHELGYQRNTSRSKPKKARKDKGVSKTDFRNLLSGYDPCTADLQEMEIEEQKEKDNKEPSNKLSSNDYDKPDSNDATLKQKNIKHFEEMEYMEIDDKIPSENISKCTDLFKMSAPNSFGSKSKMNNEYFYNSSQFTLLSVNDDNENVAVSNTAECKVIGSNDTDKCKILQLVQGKTSSVSVKMKLG